MTDYHPIEAALQDDVPPSKADLRAFAEGDQPLRLADFDALRGMDLSTSWLVFIDGVAFRRDTSDPTALDDGAWVIRDDAGNVWKRVTTAVDKFDAYGLTAARSTYNAAAAGFTFFSLDEYGFYYKQSASSGDWSALVPFRGPRGGDVYDFFVWDNGKPTSGETIIKSVFTRSVTFPAGLTVSRAKSDVAATASAVFSIKKNGVQFGTCTFGAAQSTGTFSAASETLFSAGDVLSIDAPNPRDATLAGVQITLAGTR